MSRPLTFLATVFVLVAFASPGWAQPACGSDTSSDPVTAMGKDIWLNGHCKSFLPCRLVLEQFHGCQAAEGFLSRLGAKEGQPLTEDQVADALARTTGTSTNMSACLWNFDAQGCKRYLGLGAGAGNNAVQAESAAPPATSFTEAKKRAMSQNAALVARQRVRDMDANAHTAVGVIERACQAGADKCRNTLESLVTPVIHAADELNANAEYLAHFPPHAPSSIEYAGRLGWTRQTGQWVFGGARKAGGNTTLGTYLLTADECRKLHERLDREIKAKPGQEPVELSFFKAECLPQLPDARTTVAAWQQRFIEAPAAVKAADASQQLPDRKAMENLSQWDGGLRQAEAAQKRAREEEMRRVVEQKRAEDEKLRVAEQTRRGQADVASPSRIDQSRVSTAGGRSNFGRSSCVAELRDEYIDARTRSAIQSNGQSYADNREKVVRYLDNLIAGAAANATNNVHLNSLKNSLAQSESQLKHDVLLRQRVSGGDLDTVNGRIAENKMLLCVYNWVLDDVTTTSNEIPRSGLQSGRRLSAQECEAMKQQVVATSVTSQHSITASQETVMFMTKTAIDMFDGGCQGVTAEERQRYQQAYAVAERNCNQVQSTNYRCVPRAHTSAGVTSTPRPAVQSTPERN